MDKEITYFASMYDAQKCTDTERNQVKPTGFHSALVNNDVVYVKKLFDKLDDPEITEFICNASVSLSFSAEKNTHQNLFDTENVFRAVEYEQGIEHLTDLSLSMKLDNQKSKEIHFLQLFQLPISLATLSLKNDCLELLLDNGASLFSVDTNGNNIIHTLVLLSKRDATFATQTYKCILSRIQSVDAKYNLVVAENKAGFTPLDLAAKELCVEFISVLLQTDGIYRITTLDCGPFQHVLYDISRYENKGSNKLPHHFLQHLSFVYEDDLEQFVHCQLFETEPIKTWVKYKHAKYRLPQVFWSMCWLLYYLLFSLQTAVYYHTDDHLIEVHIAIILVILAVLTSAEGLYAFCVQRHMLKEVILRFNSKGIPVAFEYHYIVFHGIFNICVLTIETLHLSHHECLGHEVMFTVLYVVACLSGCTALLFFTQFFQRMGHLLILIDRMLWDIILFIITWSLIFISFGLTFTILHSDPMCHKDLQMDTNSNTNSSGTTGMFRSLSYTLYEIFILGMTLMAPKPLHFENSHFAALAMLLFLVFLLKVTLIMNNLLIATMTQKVSFLNSHKHVIKGLQTVVLAQLVEDLSGFNGNKWFNSCLFYTANKRYIVKSKDGKQIFLHVVETSPHLRQDKYDCA